MDYVRITRDCLRNSESLLGAQEFVGYLRDLADTHSFISPKAVKCLYSRTVLFSINEGDGIHTWVSLLADLWRGLEEQYKLPVRFYDLKIPPQVTDEETQAPASPRDAMLEMLRRSRVLTAESPRVLCVDISKWTEKTDSPEFRVALARFRETLNVQYLIFRIPAVDNVTLRRVREAIEWYMNVDEIYCPPHSIEDYMGYARRVLAEKDIEADEGAMEVLRKLLIRERNTPGFYGFHTVDRLVDEMVFETLKNKYCKG